MRKLFLDDQRRPYDNTWDVVRNFNAFVEYIQSSGMPNIISFDHDLDISHYPLFESSFGYSEPPKEIPYHEYKEKTGYCCAKWLLENFPNPPKRIMVHTMNPVGRDNILGLPWPKSTVISIICYDTRLGGWYEASKEIR